jgi:predicted small secreted protein
MHRAMIIGATFLALAGCNTVSGFGQDVSAVGNALTSASNEAARPAPVKKQTATKTAAKKTTPTKVAAKSTAAKPAAKTTAAKKTTATKVAAKSSTKKTTTKAAIQPATVEVVDTGKPFKPGK